MQPGITTRHFLQRCGMGAIPRTEQHMKRREFMSLLGGRRGHSRRARSSGQSFRRSEMLFIRADEVIE